MKIQKKEKETKELDNKRNIKTLLFIGGAELPDMRQDERGAHLV